ncbi:MAG: hypothetical protein HQK97_01880 [Nitrospirae bacterium]|nr:hypothetical protein [Nitrospirota bacterium]
MNTGTPATIPPITSFDHLLCYEVKEDIYDFKKGNMIMVDIQAQVKAGDYVLDFVCSQICKLTEEDEIKAHMGKIVWKAVLY